MIYCVTCVLLENTYPAIMLIFNYKDKAIINKKNFISLLHSVYLYL